MNDFEGIYFFKMNEFFHELEGWEFSDMENALKEPAQSGPTLREQLRARLAKELESSARCGNRAEAGR